MTGSPTIGAGEIRFSDHYLPALPAGRYRVQVDQVVAGKGIGARGQAAFTHDQRFHVLGPRFGLGPSDVHAVYPPADSSGAHRQTLPHVVFRHRTLPWQIDLGLGTTSQPVPWMALLVMGPDEVGEPESGTFGELLERRGESSRLLPNVTLGIAEDVEQLVTVIDVPGTTFATVRPHPDDLRWTAHVREVRTDDKELLGLTDDGWFSVVIANRLPAAGRNIVHLVSLEGWVDALTKRPVEPIDTYRMVSLASWSFTSSDRGSFADKIGSIDAGMLRTSRRTAAPASDAIGETVDAALENGFVPLRYDMRQGEETVGWYRGPLSPVPVARTQDSGPLPTAEAGMVYHEQLGMFDVSSAVAWQIGRLLALSDRSFAESLMRWRGMAQSRIDHLVAREEAARHDRVATAFTELGTLVEDARSLARLRAASRTHGLDASEPDPPLDAARTAFEARLRALVLELWDPASIATEVSRFAVTDVFERLTTGGMLPSAQGEVGSGPSNAPAPDSSGGVDGDETPAGDDRTDHPNDPTSETGLASVESADAALGLTEAANRQIPPDLETWLGRLALLYGVPFEHLVPDSSMLPSESVRFFHVDANWLEALVDGAFSIGVHSRRDVRFHQSMHAAIREATDVAAGKLRRELRGDIDTDVVFDDRRVRGGLIMRSEIVSGWPGLEILGYESESDTAAAVPLLRMERLAPDLLLCIFEQVPTRVVVREPSENLHFGVTTDTGIVPRATDGMDPGADVNEVELVWRGKASRRLNLQKIAVKLSASPVVSAGLGGRSFGPSDFAVQMVNEPIEQPFVARQPEELEDG